MATRGKSALIIIDMLNDFVLKGAPLEVPDTRKIIPAVRRRITAARRKGETVIYVCDSHLARDREFENFGWPPHAVRGTEGARVVHALAPREGDIVVAKTTYSVFHRTSLNRVLKQRGIETLHLAGCVTNICVLYAAYEASLKGYGVHVDEGLVAGLDRKSHNFALDQMERVLGALVKRGGRP